MKVMMKMTMTIDPQWKDNQRYDHGYCDGGGSLFEFMKKGGARRRIS
jgi:hypothetical protein